MSRSFNDLCDINSNGIEKQAVAAINLLCSRLKSNKISKSSKINDNSTNEVVTKIYNLMAKEIREFEKLLPDETKVSVMKSLYDDYFNQDKGIIKKHSDSRPLSAAPDSMLFIGRT